MSAALAPGGGRGIALADFFSYEKWMVCASGVNGGMYTRNGGMSLGGVSQSSQSLLKKTIRRINYCS